jgi:predicted permease
MRLNLQAGRWFDVVRMRLRSLFRRRAVERDLDRELRSHLAWETAANQEQFHSNEQARADALRSFGGVAQIQEDCRDMRRSNYIDHFIHDLRYALRTLAKAPGFAFVIVLTLALAIGANSAIFSVVEGVLLRPLPYPQPDRVVRLFVTSRTFPKFPLNPLDLRDIRARNRSFGAIAGIVRHDVQLSGQGIEAERLTAFAITAGYFRVLGVAPAAGREFTTDDELPAHRTQVILSDRIWRTRFHSDREIVGRNVTFDDEPHKVVGIMPPVDHPGNEYHALADGDSVDVWVPFPYDPKFRGRGSHFMEIYGRLKSGVSPAEAQADMDAQFAQLARENGPSGWKPLVVSLYEELVGPSRKLLIALLAAVGMVLLIACANAANLLLARATARQREIAVRAALGAGRSRLVRQMMAESLVISMLGGVCGAVLAVGGLHVLVAFLPAGFPRAGAIHLNGVVFAFTFAIAVGTGLLFGLAPAVQAARADLQQTLREGRGSTGGARQLVLRNALVVAEIGLACILLIGAGLLLRSFVSMLRTDQGFRPERVLTAAITLPNIKYQKPVDGIAFFERLDRELGALPGVRAAGSGSDLPWTGYDENIGGFQIEGKHPLKGQDFNARYHTASEDYFQALGIPLLHGRFFTAHDNRDGARVIIINRVMARNYWGTENAVGGRISVDNNPKPSDWFTVVGVVGDIKDRPNSVNAGPAFWWPVLESPFGVGNMAIAVRGQADGADLAGEVRAAVRSLDPDLAVANVSTMSDVADRLYSPARFSFFLAALFAALAAALAAIGIYGVISYSVSRRTHEFGLRMALGAEPGDVVRQVMAQGVRLAAVGIVLGLAGAFALGRWLISLLYETKPADPLTFACVAGVAVVIAVVACYIPARRATSASPMAALRAE